MQKILTISIAAYNVEKYIRQTLESLCDEEIIRDLEVFVVDDGGTDNTLEIAQEFENKYPESIKAIHKENGGWGSTVNYSIKNATGKYFRLLDGDDYFNKEQLKGFIHVLKEVDTDVVYTPFRRFDDKTGRTIQKFDAKKDVPRNVLLDIDAVADVDFAMHGSTFKTGLLKENNISVLEKCFYTDNEYRTKAMAYAKKAYITNFQIYQYRVGREGQSISVLGLKRHINDSLSVVKEIYSFKKELTESTNINLVQAYLQNAIKFHYNALIIIGEKEKLEEFDDILKNFGESYYKIDDKTIIRLRKNCFANIKFASLVKKLRRNIAMSIRLLVSPFQK